MAPTSGSPVASTSASGFSKPKRNLMDDSDSDSDDGGAQIENGDFKVNEDYARRFEYNKKIEERHKCEQHVI